MPRSLRAHLLIATRRLRDPNFHRSVVLVVEHNREGAMGLVLNRPSAITVATALEPMAQIPETGELVYMGGPVETKALFILHNAADLQSSDHEILPGVFLGAGPEDFETIVQRVVRGDAGLRFRIFFGCSGWSPRQLDSEVKNNDWMSITGSPEFVFPDEPYTLWERASAEHLRLHPPIPGGCPNPQWN